MKVAVISNKGGVGKSSISFLIAKHFEAYCLSNDGSILEKIYDKGKIVEELPVVNDDVNMVYDFGGWADNKSVKVISDCDKVFIITNLDPNSIEKMITSMETLKTYNKNISVIINKIDNSKLKKYQSSIDFIENNVDVPIFKLNQSEGIVNAYFEGLNLLEMINSNGLNKRNYSTIEEQFKQIIEYIKGKWDGIWFR